MENLPFVDFIYAALGTESEMEERNAMGIKGNYKCMALAFPAGMK